MRYESGTKADISKLSNNQLRNLINALVEKFGDNAEDIVIDAVERSRWCWIVTLPQEISCEIFSNWLYQRDICKLDTAFCSQKRDWYLDCCLREDMILGPVSSTTQKTSTEFHHNLQWLYTRKLKQRELYISTPSIVDVNLLVSYTQLYGRYIQKLDFSNITSEYLEYNHLKSILTYCINIEEFILGNNHIFIDDIYTLLLTTCQSLKRLDLSINYNLPIFQNLTQESNRWTNETVDIDNIILKSIKLKEIIFTNDKYLLNKHIIKIGKYCNNIIKIHINNCILLTEVSLLYIINQCNNIINIKADNVSGFNDAVIELISKKLKNIEILSINNCSNITNNSINLLINNCFYIKQLEFSNNININDNILLNIYQKCSEIQILNLSNCQNCTIEGILTIIKLCKKLELLIILDYSVEVDEEVRRELYARKLWLGDWSKRDLCIRQSSQP